MISLDLTSRDINRINVVDLLVSKYYNISLYDFCEKYKYDVLFIEIIKQVTFDYNYKNRNQISVNLPDCLDDRYYAVEEKFSYGADNRRVAERIISLGVNWVVEDVIVHKSSSVFVLSGCDSLRDLLTSPITNSPDIHYVGDGNDFYVEVCSDFTQFMKRENRYDIRKLKYSKLEDIYYMKTIQILLLFVDVVNKTFYMTPFHPQPYDFHNKYIKNTITFELPEYSQFQDLIKLFEVCKVKQPNPSLYSNFNVEKEEIKVQPIKKWVKDKEDENYWNSLYESEPPYIKCRIVSEEELNGGYPDPYELEVYGYDYEMEVEDGRFDTENLEKLVNSLESQERKDKEIPDEILELLKNMPNPLIEELSKNSSSWNMGVVSENDKNEEKDKEIESPYPFGDGLPF